MTRTPEPVKTTPGHCNSCGRDTNHMRIPGIGLVCDYCLMHPGTIMGASRGKQGDRRKKKSEQIEMFN